MANRKQQFVVSLLGLSQNPVGRAASFSHVHCCSRNLSAALPRFAAQTSAIKPKSCSKP
jgi:hypothetical protein